MFNYLPMFIFVACVSFYLGVRIDSYRWRQRCNVMLTAMEAMQKKLYKRKTMASERHGTYIGSIEKLKGKTALLLPGGDSFILRAQFEDIDTGYGFGWHTFTKSSFEIDPEVDSDDTDS